MSKLYLFFLYCDFPEIIGTHSVFVKSITGPQVNVRVNVYFLCMPQYSVDKYQICRNQTSKYTYTIRTMEVDEGILMETEPITVRRIWRTFWGRHVAFIYCAKAVTMGEAR